MMTLDEELAKAAEKVRSAARAVPNRPWIPPIRPTRQRLLLALAAAAAVFVVLGLPALLMGNGGASGDQPDAAAPATSASAPGSLIEQPPTEGLPYLIVDLPRWSPINVEQQEPNVFGDVVAITFEEMSEDDSGSIVVLELGVDGKHFIDTMEDLETSGVEQGRSVVVRNRDALLRRSGTGRWSLQWSEIPAVTDAILVLLRGDSPEVLLEVAEALVPVSEDEWLEMTLQDTNTTLPPTVVEAPIAPQDDDWIQLDIDVWVAFGPQDDPMGPNRLWVKTDGQEATPAPSTDTRSLYAYTGSSELIVIIVDISSEPQPSEVTAHWSNGTSATGDVVWDTELGIGLARITDVSQGADLAAVEGP